jgi:hypothetical protein
LDFRQHIVALFDKPVTPASAADIVAECLGIERANPYIPSDFKWILDYKRFQAALQAQDRAAALAHLKAAIALAPYRQDLQSLYHQVLQKEPADASVVLVISCKRYENKAIDLARQLEAANVLHLIISGDDTAPIDHPQAVQVAAPDNYESLPRKVTAAYQWVYENIGSRVGILKVDDDQTLTDPARLADTLQRLNQQNAYAGVAVTDTSHDRCWHWNKCSDPALNRRAYGKPFHRPWARGGAYYLGPEPLEKFVMATIRFPGLLEGEYYEDKFVGDVMTLENVPLVRLESDRDFGLVLDEAHRFSGA